MIAKGMYSPDITSQNCKNKTETMSELQSIENTKAKYITNVNNIKKSVSAISSKVDDCGHSGIKITSQ